MFLNKKYMYAAAVVLSGVQGELRFPQAIRQ